MFLGRNISVSFPLLVFHVGEDFFTPDAMYVVYFVVLPNYSEHVADAVPLSCDASLVITTLLPDPPFLCTTYALFQDSDEEAPSEASDPGLPSDDDDESEDSPVILAPRKKQRVGRQVRLPARLRDSQVELGGGDRSTASGGVARSASGGVNVSSFIDAASGISSVQGGEVAAPTQRHLSQTGGASNAAVAAAPGAGSSSSRFGPSASWRTTPDPIAVRSGSTGNAFSNTAARQGGPSYGGRTMAASGQRGAPSQPVVAGASRSSGGARGAASFGRIGTGSSREGGVTEETTVEQLVRFIKPASIMAKAGLMGVLIKDHAPTLVRFSSRVFFFFLLSPFAPIRLVLSIFLSCSRMGVSVRNSFLRVVVPAKY